MNSRIDYLYRDASNYKRFGSVVVEGELLPADWEMIRSRLEMGELFVAEQVGLPSLRNEWLAEGLAPSRDGIGWHWLMSIVPTADDSSLRMSARELRDRFKAVEAWRFDIELS